LRSWACGINPVVASEVGGIPEQIIIGNTGFLVPLGNTHAITGLILCLLADKELRITVGNAAAEDVAE